MLSFAAISLACAAATVSGKVFQIKLAQGADPTSMSIVWSSNGTSISNSQVLYGTVKTALTVMAEGDQGMSYTYQSFDIERKNKAVGAFFPKYTSPLIHTVRLNNLSPGTTYYYRCGDIASSDLSPIISFTTLPAVGSVLNSKGNPMTFAMLADTSTNGVVNGTKYVGFMNLTVANIISNPLIGMVLLAGDLGYAGITGHR